MPNTALQFLYEDEHLFVVIKPFDLHSVEIEGGGDSLAGALLRHQPQLAFVSDRQGDAGLVQRLDFSTSGLVLGAKSREVWELLRADVDKGGVKKRYVALLSGIVSDTMHIGSFLGSPYRGGRKVRVYEKDPGKKARALYGETTFSPLSTDSLGNTLVAVIASPARRHQIRAHASYLKQPLVGDVLYGSQEVLSDKYCDTREFFLHSEWIHFTHPITKSEITLTAPYELPLPRL
jgi:23S rRNA-/tRNA-specific pseudouridylate synthase